MFFSGFLFAILICNKKIRKPAMQIAAQFLCKLAYSVNHNRMLSDLITYSACAFYFIFNCFVFGCCVPMPACSRALRKSRTKNPMRGTRSEEEPGREWTHSSADSVPLEQIRWNILQVREKEREREEGLGGVRACGRVRG